jgi:hypothetical protein
MELHGLAAFITCTPYTATSLRWFSLGLTFSACKNRITPFTSQSAGFDIGAFIVTTRYTHNVKKFAAPTAPRNCLHFTEHTKWLIWYNEATARVVYANVLYFPNDLRTFIYEFLKRNTSFVLHMDSDVVCLDIDVVYLIKNMLNELRVIIIPVWHI